MGSTFKAREQEILAMAREIAIRQRTHDRRLKRLQYELTECNLTSGNAVKDFLVARLGFKGWQALHREYDALVRRIAQAKEGEPILVIREHLGFDGPETYSGRKRLIGVERVQQQLRLALNDGPLVLSQRNGEIIIPGQSHLETYNYYSHPETMFYAGGLEWRTVKGPIASDFLAFDQLNKGFERTTTHNPRAPCSQILVGDQVQGYFLSKGGKEVYEKGMKMLSKQ